VRLVFVRHAESIANTAGSLDCSVPGPRLSPLGFEQARALPDTIVPDLDSAPVHAIWASSMLRAQQTAQPLADRLGLPVNVHPLAHEGHVGDLNGRVDDEAHQALDDLFACFQIEEDLDQRRPGGESGTELIGRMRQVIADVLASLGDMAAGDGVAVVISHGAILRVALSRLCEGVKPAYTLAHHLPNTARVVVDVAGDRLLCRTWNGTVPG
jgi:probable phosphoglycerate mutase